MGIIKPMKKNILTLKNKIQGENAILSFHPVLARLMNKLKAYSCNCKTISF